MSASDPKTAASNKGHVSTHSRKLILVVARKLDYQNGGASVHQQSHGFAGHDYPFRGWLGTHCFRQVLQGVQRAVSGTGDQWFSSTASRETSIALDKLGKSVVSIPRHLETGRSHQGYWSAATMGEKTSKEQPNLVHDLANRCVAAPPLACGLASIASARRGAR